MSSCEDSNINKSYVIQTVGDVDIFSACTEIYLTNIIPCTGDTININSNLNVTGNISGTTYYGDGSQLSGIITTDNFVTGGIYSATTQSLYFTGTTGFTPFNVDVSALIDDTNFYVTGGTYDPATDIISLFRNDNVTIDITGVTDTFTTGGTYDNGTSLITFVKNDNTSYTVDLSSIDVNDTFVTGSTLNGDALTIRRNDGVDIVVTGFSQTFTGNTSGTCIGDIYVSNIHSCSPLRINSNDEGNVYFGSTSGITLDVLNQRVGIGTNSPTEALVVSGNTIVGGTLTIGNIPNGIPVNNLGFDSGGTVVVGTTGDTDTNTFVTGGTLSGNDLILEKNNNVDVNPIDLSGLVSGKTDLTLFNSHTGDTSNPHQTSFGNLTSTAHTHTLSEITDFNTYSGDVQTQIDGKVETTVFNSHTGDTNNPHQTSFSNLTATAHTHSISDVINLQTELDSKTDNTDFASHTGDTTIHFTKGDISLSEIGNSAHTHTLSEITDFNPYSGGVQTQLDVKVETTVFNSHTGDTNNPHQTSFSNLTATAHTHTISEVVNLQTELDSKTDLTLFNTHTGDTNNPHQTSFANLTSTAHTHNISDVINLQTELDSKLDVPTFNSYSGNVETELNTKISGATNLSSEGIFAQKNGLDLEFKGITSTGGTININSNANSVNIEVNPTILDKFVSGGTYNGGTKEINFVGNSPETTFDVDLTSLVSSVSGDTFVTGQTFSNSTYILSTTRNDGTTFNTDLSVLATDIYVLSGVYNTATGIVTYTNSTGGTFQVSGFTTGMTDSYTTAANLNGETIEFDNNIQGSNLYNVSLSPVLSGKTDLTLFNSHTGDTNNPHQTSFSNLTSTAHTHTLSEITDFNSYSGNVQTQLDTKIENGINSGGANEVFSGKSGTDLYFRTLSGGSNTTISTIDDIIRVDVTIPPDTNTFVTGFTYNNTNTFTISRNNGLSALTATINTVSALTVTDYVDYTTTTKPSAISGRTYFDRDENALSYFPNTPANDVTINIGQESVIKVYNGTGLQINNGQACHIGGTSPNGIPSVILAIATGNTSTGAEYEVSGVATHDIPNGTEGFITAFGLVRDLNITGITEGNEIYLSDTTPGEIIYSTPTNIASRLSQIGWVIKTGATDAKILVQIENEVGYSDLSNSLINVIAENNSSTGTRNGGEMTINSGDNTLFDISAGSGIIVDNYTDPNIPTITNVVWGDITGNTVTNLTGATASFIFLDSNLNTVQFANTNPPTEADYRDNIYLGILGHANFTNIINAFNAPISIVSPINQLQDLTSSIGPFSIGGNKIQNINNTLKLLKTEGRSYFHGGNFHTDNKIPSSITTSQLSGTTLVYATGANVLGPTSSDIDPNNYDPDGLGVINAIPGVNGYVAHRIWHNPQQNLLVFQYGQDFYPNAAAARDEFEFENFVVPAGLNDVSYLVAVIIARDGDTDLNSATIIPQGKFAGTGGGGGSVADTLQTAYDNSSSPEILTDATRGAVDFRVGSGSDTDNVVTFQQNSGTINGFVKGTGDAKFTNLTGNSVTSNSAINVFNGHINLRDNSYFLQGRTVADVNVSLIGVDNQDRVFVGNAGYDTYIDSDTIVDGVLSAQTAFLITTPTLNNSATDILVRNSSTGEVEYRPVSGITPDTNTFVTGSTVSANTLTITRNDLQDILLLSGGTNAQFIDNGNNSITLNVTSGGGGGASVSFPWKFKEPTASSDPGSGHFRLNSAVASGITEIYVSDETNNGIDASNFLNIIDTGDIIYIQQNDDASRALLFSVSAATTDNTGWFTIPVEYLQGSTIPKKDKICGWIFASTGAEDNTVSNVGVGQGVFKQRNVNDFEFYSLSGGTNTTVSLNGDTIVIDSEDIFTTGATYDNGTATATFRKNDGTTYPLDLSAIDVNDTFSTGGTVTQSATNSNPNQTIQIVGNDGFSSYDITGVTDTFVTGFTYNGNNTFTISRNDGNSFNSTFNQVSGLTVNGDLLVTGTTTASTLNLSTTPVENNDNTEVLSRNSSSGNVEYRSVQTIGNNITTVTATTYSATTIDDVIGVDTTSNAVSVYLPDSVSSGKLRYYIKDIGLNSLTNNITIIASGSDTILTTASVTSLILSNNGVSITLVNNGSGQWWQI